MFIHDPDGCRWKRAGAASFANGIATDMVSNQIWRFVNFLIAYNYMLVYRDNKKTQAFTQ